MAKYELPIYGAGDEITKKYETNVCAWGIYLRAAEIEDEFAEKGGAGDFEQLQAINEVLKLLFIGITDEELARADANDVVNTFKQISQIGKTKSVASVKNI